MNSSFKPKFGIGARVKVKKGWFASFQGKVVNISNHQSDSGKRCLYIVDVNTPEGVKQGAYFSYNLEPAPKQEDEKPRVEAKKEFPKAFAEGTKVRLSEIAKKWLIEHDPLHSWIKDINDVFTISKVYDDTLTPVYRLEECKVLTQGSTLNFYHEDLIALPAPKYKVGDKVRFTRTSLVKLAIEKSIYFGESTIDKLPDIITNVREINWWGYHKDRVCYSVTGETFGKYFYEEELEPVVPTQAVSKEEPENKNVNKDYINSRTPAEYHRRLKSNWKEICNRYFQEFCIKHEFKYEPDMWVGDDPGTIVEVCDMFVSMENIRYDVDNNVPEDTFAKWYWKNLELYELGVEHWMNYPSYCKGAPDEWTEERIARLKDSKKRLDEAEQDFKRVLNEEITRKNNFGGHK